MATVYEKISELQGEFNPDSCAFEIGEQLKDICRRDPACEAILLEDLQNPAMDLKAADKMIYDWGKKQAKGKGGYGISGRQAEKLLREFYGLPEAGAAAPAAVETATTGRVKCSITHLIYFIRVFEQKLHIFR